MAKAGEVKRGWLTGIVSVNFLNRAADLEFWYYKDRLYRIDIEFQTRFQEYEDEVAMLNFLNKELIPLFDEMYGPTPKKYAIPAKENIYEDWISDLAVWELPRKTVTVGINADIYKSYDKKDTNKVISVTYYYELTVIIKDNELAAEKEQAEEAAKNQIRQQAMKDL